MDRRKADDNRLNCARLRPGTTFAPDADGAQETTRDKTTSDECERVGSACRRERRDCPTTRLQRDSRLDYRIAPPRKISQNRDHRPGRGGSDSLPYGASPPAFAVQGLLLDWELGA
jgi:hypothetical protein